MVFHKGFLGHKLLALTQFHLVLSHLWPKYFASWKYCSYPCSIKRQIGIWSLEYLVNSNSHLNMKFKSKIKFISYLVIPAWLYYMMCLLNFNNFLKSFAIFANYATKYFIILGKFYKSCQKLRFLSNFAIYATKKFFIFVKFCKSRNKKFYNLC